MSERSVIISDLHMGRRPRRCRADMLRPLWQGAKHLIINGDVAELYDPRYMTQAAEETLRLKELCDADGVTLTLLAGNHDPDVSELRYLQMLDGKVLITHGDSVHPAIAPWCRTAPIMQQAFDDTLDGFPAESREHLANRLTATRMAAKAKWAYIKTDLHSIGFGRMLKRPWSFVEVLQYWRSFPDEAAALMERYMPEARIIVTGHTHRQGIWQRGERTIINTGAFAFPAFPRAVVVEGRNLSVFKVTRTNSVYVLKSQPTAVFAV